MVNALKQLKHQSRWAEISAIPAALLFMPSTFLAGTGLRLLLFEPL